MFRGIALLLLAALAPLAASAKMEFLPGSSPQTVKAFEALPVAIQVRITDDRTGLPLPGAQVGFTLGPSGFTLAGVTDAAQCSSTIPPFSQCTATADANGVATLPRLRTVAVGRFSLAIYLLPYPATGTPLTLLAEVNVTPAIPLPEIAVISGANQRVPLGARAQPITVRITRNGQPLAGPTFALGKGRDGLHPTVSFDPPYNWMTDANGVVTTSTWTATMELGSGTFLARVASDPSGGTPTVAIPFSVVNASGLSYVPYAPLWWGGARQSGWGVSMSQHEERLFPVYYTYDEAGQPTWALLEGRWLDSVGATYVGPLNRYVGAPYFAFDREKVHVTSSLTTAITFGGSGTGATLDLNSNTAQIKPPPPTISIGITPFTFAPAAKRAELGVSDIWWGGVSQSGWGISIAEDQGNLFLAWFTYDAAGKATWFFMPDGAWVDAGTWKGGIYRSTGSGRLADAYDARAYQATKVGDFTIAFAGTSHATFTYSLEGHAGALNLERYNDY